MEHSSISVEDFQDYYNHPTVGDEDGTAHSSPQATNNRINSPSTNAFDDDSASFSDSAHGQSSGPDDEAVFDTPNSRTSSPRTSHGSSDEDISILGSTHTLSRHVSGVPFTPSKSRSPFHHPSSVRAMQLDTTPPHLTTPSSQRKRLHTRSGQSSTPRSARSGHRSTPSKLMNSSPIKTMKKEHPLVLLHITLLPLPRRYTLEVLEAVLPPNIFATWKLLLERTTPTVLHRGVLIPHPREDYDMLEERLLESLELKQPRILKCGHFHLSPEEEADIEAGEDEDQDGEELTDADTCEDCGRIIRDGRHGNAGTGSKRWDVKVFAANGLMRAGAWSAAWREMERVDVEILPWMEESVRRELDLRSEEHTRIQTEDEHAEREEEGVAGLDDERLREIYGETASFRGTPAKGRIQDEIDGLIDSTSSPSSTQPQTADKLPRSPSQSPFKISDPQRQQQTSQIPLSNLLRNFLYHAAQDPRNIAIWLLSAIVLFLSIRALSDLPSSQLATTASLETTQSQMAVPTTITSATIPTVPEQKNLVADAIIKNGGSSLMSTAASTMAGITGNRTPLSPELSPEPKAEPKTEPSTQPPPQQENEESSGKGVGAEEASSWTEVAGQVVSGFIMEEEEDLSLPEG